MARAGRASRRTRTLAQLLGAPQVESWSTTYPQGNSADARYEELRRGLRNQFQRNRARDGLRSITHPKPLAGLAEVLIYRARRYAEVVGDLGRCQTSRSQLQALDLARAEEVSRSALFRSSFSLRPLTLIIPQAQELTPLLRRNRNARDPCCPDARKG